MSAAAAPHPAPLRAAGAPGDAASAALARLLTVVVNTSPCASHPGTRLLEETVASFALAPGLLACRLLLVADGYKLREQTRVKKGAVTPQLAASYARFLARVELLMRRGYGPLAGAELVALQERHGCAHALRRGLARVATPFVLVVQHGARRRCVRSRLHNMRSRTAALGAQTARCSPRWTSPCCWARCKPRPT